MNTTNWKDLIVTAAEGECGESLGSLLQAAPANLDNAVITDGKISEWPQMLLSAPGEDPDWDTPKGEIDWTGFEDALNAARDEVEA